MNIKELIERMQTGGDEAISTRQKLVIAEALLAQQVVIGQMQEALNLCRPYMYEHASNTIDNAFDTLCDSITLQLDLSALREHDAAVIAKFAKYADDHEVDVLAAEYIERIRKGK